MVSLVRLLKSRMLGNHLSGSERDEAATGLTRISSAGLEAPRLLDHGASRGLRHPPSPPSPLPLVAGETSEDRCQAFFYMVPPAAALRAAWAWRRLTKGEPRRRSACRYVVRRRACGLANNGKGCEST